MTKIAAWTALAAKVRQAAHAIFQTASVTITEKGFSDEKVLGLALLARTVSHLNGTLLLVQAKRIVEARTITRCCLENGYWVAALCEDADGFAREMLHDEMSHRRARAQFIFQSDIELADEIEGRLREWMKNTKQPFAQAKTLTPKQVAFKTDFGRSYLFYGQLSSDSAHPTVDSLNRYMVPHTADEIGGIDVEPIVKDSEIEETLEYLCMAAMGVCVGVNQILGGTPGGQVLNKLADEYIGLSNRSAGREQPVAQN